MFERLEALLTQLATPAQKKMILEACQALAAHNLWESSVQIDDLILAADDTNDSGNLTFNIIEHALLPTYRTTLQSMGIALTEDATLEDFTRVFTAIVQIETYEEPYVIYGLAAGDEENEDLLAEILTMFSDQSAEYFIALFDRVEDALLNRIAETTAGQEPAHLPYPEDYARAKARVRRLVDYIGAQDSGALAAIDLMQVRLGLNAEATLAAHRARIETLDDRQAAYQIVLHTYSSDVEDATLETVAAREVELVFEDLMRAMSVARLVSKTIQQVGYA